MNVRMILLLNATMMFTLASVFLIIAKISQKKLERNIKNFQGEVEGEILQVIKAGKEGVSGKLFNTFVVYQYIINNHKYIVKPYVLRKNAPINQKYFDTENCTCITYIGTHGWTSQTKYYMGENIKIKYNLENPKKHEIINDKDKIFAYKSFKLAGKLIMIIPILLVVISFFVKD